MSDSEDAGSHFDHMIEHALSCSDKEFSGFEAEDIPVVREELVHTSSPPKVVTTKKKVTQPKLKGEKKQEHKSKSKSGLDINKLTKDLKALRCKLFLDNEEHFLPDYYHDVDENDDPSYREDYKQGRRMTVQVDRNDISDSESDFRGQSKVKVP